MRVSTVGEMRRLDQGAIEQFGVPDLLLMENAGEAVYYEIVQTLGIDGRRFTVIGGPGNNGGDSFVVARKLHSSGAQVRVLIFAEVERFAGPVQMNYEMIHRGGVRILVDPTSDEIAESLSWCDVVVDGLLGTGLTREVEGRFRQIIEQVNSAEKQVVAVDIPSGVDGDTGQVRGVAIRADTTVTFGLPKRGNLLPPGSALNGRLVVTHISFPPKLLDDSGILVSVTEPSRLPAGPIGHRDSSSGEVLCIGGSRDAFEAPGLAALAVLRVGRCRVRLAVPQSTISFLAELDSQSVLAPQAETPSGSLALSALEGLLSLGRDADFVVLGPGLSSDPETRELVRRLVAGLEKPLLMAADGATAVAAAPEVLRGRPGGTVLLLPHDELSRITITSPPTSDREGDPIPPLQDVAEALGIIPVLQGDPTLIGFPDRRVSLNLTGASVHALAGSSEVMAGTITAMYSLGLPLEEAVKTGVFLHGAAGDSAVRGRDPGEMDTRTLLERLPVAAEALRDHYDDIRAEGPGTIEVI
jgi:hydroxyethylthiazole kinase-like uncharacterized protein yjeF